MIKLFVAHFCGLFLALASVSADLVVEQQMESAAQNGKMTMKIKGEKIRTDLPSGPAGDISSIVDLGTGDSLTLVHKQKTAMKASGEQTKQLIELMKKQLAGANAGKEPTAKPQPTGKSEKVGAFDTEIYTWTLPTATYTFWIAKDFPNYAKIKPQLEKLDQAASGGLGQGLRPDYGALPGMAVKTTIEVAGQKITTTVLSVKEEAVDASVFDAPKDYQQIVQPPLPGGPAVPK